MSGRGRLAGGAPGLGRGRPGSGAPSCRGLRPTRSRPRPPPSAAGCTCGGAAGGVRADRGVRGGGRPARGCGGREKGWQRPRRAAPHAPLAWLRVRHVNAAQPGRGLRRRRGPRLAGRGRRLLGVRVRAAPAAQPAHARAQPRAHRRQRGFPLRPAVARGQTQRKGGAQHIQAAAGDAARRRSAKSAHRWRPAEAAQPVHRDTVGGACGKGSQQQLRDLGTCDERKSDLLTDDG